MLPALHTHAPVRAAVLTFVDRNQVVCVSKIRPPACRATVMPREDSNLRTVVVPEILGFPDRSDQNVRIDHPRARTAHTNVWDHVAHRVDRLVAHRPDARRVDRQVEALFVLRKAPTVCVHRLVVGVLASKRCYSCSNSS